LTLEQNPADFLDFEHETMDEVMIKQEEINDFYNDTQTPTSIKSSSSFNCDICGKLLKTKGSVTKHIQLHSDERKFECTLCTKKFKSNPELKRHVMVHQEKQFPCLICQKVFSRKDNLGRHMKDAHSTKLSSQSKRPERNNKKKYVKAKNR
jgi:uncharacterized Zn-finger protein